MYADLHVHTDASDGNLSPGTVPAAARAADLGVVAVTDHDRLHPDLEGPVAEHGAVTVVAGIELRVEAPPGRVDLLGYAVRRTDALTALTERLQADRVERGRAMVERVEDRLGVELGLAVEPGFGRPHLATAVAAHPELSYTVEEVFADLIGASGPCYVRREVPEFGAGREVLGEACSLVALAHPLRYSDVEGALALCAELDAVEGPYPYGGDADLAAVRRAARRHDLLVTGGSDAHGETVGAAGLDRAAYAPVGARLTGTYSSPGPQG